MQRVLGLMIVGVLLFPTACSALLASGSWNYRMTVEVETPEGLRTGSAVRKVRLVRQPAPLPEMSPAKINVKGEAVVVDLGERGQLYALLRSERSVDYAHSVVYDAFPNPHTENMHGELVSEAINYYSDLDASRVLPVRLYPMLVMFTDPSEPKSVQIALKTEKSEPMNKYAEATIVEDNFAQLFGEGVRLKRITIEMTEDRVTRVIEAYLPWLSKYYNKKFDGRTIETINTENRLANQLAAGFFSTEAKK